MSVKSAELDGIMIPVVKHGVPNMSFVTKFLDNNNIGDISISVVPYIATKFVYTC